MTLNQGDVTSIVESIIDMIEKRGEEVLSANNMTNESDPQYQWIKGIYNDIAEYLKSQF